MAQYILRTLWNKTIIKMKFFVLLVMTLLGWTQASDWVPKTAAEIKEIRQECLKEHPISAENMLKMKHFDFPDEESVRQYLHCSAVKMGVFCNHEGYHADRLAKQFKMDLEESEVLIIAEGCIDKNEQGSPVDVWAFRGHKCIMESKIGEKVKAYIKRKQEEQHKDE